MYVHVSSRVHDCELDVVTDQFRLFFIQNLAHLFLKHIARSATRDLLHGEGKETYSASVLTSYRTA